MVKKQLDEKKEAVGSLKISNQLMKASVFVEIARLNKYDAALVLQPEYKSKMRKEEEWTNLLKEIKEKPITK